eukprot:4887707-Pyramimonas_sp.AAC.1
MFAGTPTFTILVSRIKSTARRSNIRTILADGLLKARRSRWRLEKRSNSRWRWVSSVSRLRISSSRLEESRRGI